MGYRKFLLSCRLTREDDVRSGVAIAPLSSSDTHAVSIRLPQASYRRRVVETIQLVRSPESGSGIPS